MNVHKITLYVVDFDKLGADSVRDAIENAHYPNRCVSPSVLDVQTKDIGEWSDDNPLNRTDTCTAEIVRLFGGAT